MGNWARIHQRFGKNSNEVTKREILTNGDYKKKMANVGEKGKKLVKNGEFKGLANYKWEDKNGYLDKWQFYKTYKFGKQF